MKKILFLCTFFMAIAANAQPIQSEDFNFTGALTSNGWVATSAGGTNPILAATPGLSYSTYHGSGRGGAATLTTSGEDLKLDLRAPITTGKLYATFMCRVTSSSGTGDYFCGFTSGTAGTNYNLRFYVRRDTLTNKIAFGIGRSNGTPVSYSAANYDLNTVYLATIVYEYVMGTTNDVCSFYIHPTNMVSNTEQAATARYDAASGTDGAEINAFYLRQGSATNNVAAVVDGIHIGTTWASTFLRPSAVAEFNSDDFKIYPSLAKDILSLDIKKGMGAAQLQIVNMAGQVVQAQKLQNTEGVQTLSISDLAQGAYIIRLLVNGRELTQRFEKQ